VKRRLPVVLPVGAAILVGVIVVWGIGSAREIAIESVIEDPTSEPVPSASCITDVAPDALTDGPNLADYLTYVPSVAPITKPVTKFGGQPVWIEEPQWPLSAVSGQQMAFVGQIAIDPDLFPGAAGRMAYIFVGHPADPIVAPWEPDSGENAVIIQPSTASPPVEVVATAIGPQLPSETEGISEYSVTPDRRTDDAFIPLIDLVELPEQQMLDYQERLVGDKIGGTPTFLQNDEFPSCEEGYSLLWQVEAPPVWINLGDGGVGFAFLDATGETGRFLSQSH